METLLVGTAERPHRSQAPTGEAGRLPLCLLRAARSRHHAGSADTEDRVYPRSAENGADRVKGLCLHARSRKSATQSGSLTRAPNWITKSAGGIRGCCRSETTCTVPSND